MKMLTLLADLIASAAVTAQSGDTFYGLVCQTSGGSPSATDINNMGIALQQAPQSTTNYCSAGAQWYIFSRYNSSALTSLPILGTTFPLSWLQKCISALKEPPSLSFVPAHYFKEYLLTARLWSATVATWNTAAVNICGEESTTFCIFGSTLGPQIQNLAITCRNGNNLSGGEFYGSGSDGNRARVAVFHS
jgi:hypothetical protein